MTEITEYAVDLSGNHGRQQRPEDMGCDVLFRVRLWTERGCMGPFFLGVNHVGREMNIISQVLTFPPSGSLLPKMSP